MLCARDDMPAEDSDCKLALGLADDLALADSNNEERGITVLVAAVEELATIRPDEVANGFNGEDKPITVMEED